METRNGRRSSGVLAVVLCGWAGVLHAQPLVDAPRLSDEALGELRGGFVTGEGIQISFGYESWVNIDGVRQSHGSLHLSNLQLGSREALQASLLDNMSALLGPDGVRAGDQDLQSLLPDLYVLIQNATDGAMIQSQRTLTVEMVGLGNLNQRYATHSLVTPQLIDALR